jgi:hypothetical protein
VKRVVVIASGATEREALPQLVRHLEIEGISLLEVRVPPRNATLTPEMARRLVAAAWWEHRAVATPDKFVVLVDADGAGWNETLRSLEATSQVPPGVLAPLRCAVAKWHLEAWFFADEPGLRAFLRGDVGSVDCAQPDAIVNPKHHLKNLLRERGVAEVYTAKVAGRIATELDGSRAAERSSSFAHFLDAVRNGAGSGS